MVAGEPASSHSCGTKIQWIPCIEAALPASRATAAHAPGSATAAPETKSDVEMAPAVPVAPGTERWGEQVI